MPNGIDTIDDVISRLPVVHYIAQLPAPVYRPASSHYNCRLGLAVASMKDHTTNEGYEIFRGLEHNGYKLCGYGIGDSKTDLFDILGSCNPSTVIVQDKREWDVAVRDFREPRARFIRIGILNDRSDIFRVTILKDAHQRPEYHRDSAQEMGANAWICYYHPRIVHHLAPYTRIQHLVRTYHTLDPSQVPDYAVEGRRGCLLSGAVSNAYPLRQQLVKSVRNLLETKYLPHPGYHRNGSATPDYLKLLSKFKVAICTSSVYGYALRKIIEATACGCRVITNLPSDEVLPGIDYNLVRIPSNVSIEFLNDVIRNLCTSYDPELQQYQAQIALETYDYRKVTATLQYDIACLQQSYNRPIIAI